MSVRVHLLYTGEWLPCEDESCGLPFHVSDLTPEEVAEIPLVTLLPLFEVIDPPRQRIAENKVWSRPDGRTHRGYDLPAIVSDDGSMGWYKQGKRHRAGGKPAVIYANGRKLWLEEEKLHRLDGPAVIEPDGYEAWYIRGVLQKRSG